MKKGQILSLLLCAIALLLLFAGWKYRFELYDSWRLRDYDPPTEIVQLADDTTMTDYARRLFYVHRAQLKGPDTFRQKCTIAEESIVLGCYVTHQSIYIFDVQDERLEGIKQVTAAHEMLHAAYDRLSVSERERIDTLTTSYFATLDNPRLTRTIDAYRAREPGIVPNELHSILPTEVRELPDELEEYYKRYFIDRLRIVSYAENYEAAFEQRRAKVAGFDEELRNLKSQIEALQDSLGVQAQAIDAERRRLDELLAANRTNEYNAGVNGFNALVQRYNSDVSALQGLIDRFNNIVAERNSIALEENELIQAIDSRPKKIETQSSPQ